MAFQQISIAELERRALESVQRIFPCEDEFLKNIPIEDIVRAKQDQIKPQEKPFLIRVTGQSGSGKSTQLIPALEDVLQGQEYVKINVGTFAPFHPNYQKWRQENADLVREKTNGFALRALILFYKYCVELKVNILFDMTLLEPEIEEYLMGFAKQKGYWIQLHVLCVPKQVSDYFIRKRYQKMRRYVSTKSANYFFNALAPALKSLIGRPFFEKEDTLWLWTHYHPYPIKRTTFFNHSVSAILMKSRQNKRIKQPAALLKSKKTWLRLFKRAW